MDKTDQLLETENAIDYHKVDKFNLDRELERHSFLYKEEGKKLADAEEQVSFREMELEIVDSELSLNIRKNPGKYGIKNVTERSVRDVIVLQSEHQKAAIRLIKAEKLVGYLKASVHGLGQKKGHIEKMCDLFLSGYYASPKPGREKPFDKRNSRGEH